MVDGAFAFGAGIAACTDGQELLVYSAADEAPRWHKRLAAPILNATANGDLVAVDAEGRLTRFGAFDGERRGETTLEGRPRAMAGAAGGKVAVALEGAAVIVSEGKHLEIPVAKGTALAFAGERLAIGTEDGKLVLLDGDAQRAQGEIGDAVRGVARHPNGFWLATAGDRVLIVDDRGTTALFSRLKGKSPSKIAVSRDGALVAVKVDSRSVMVLGYPSKQMVLAATYTDREPVDVAFSDDGAFVWIGVGAGDANKIEIDTEDVYRTDPHAGRPRATWTVRVAVDKAARAKARGRAAQGGAPKSDPGPARATGEASSAASRAPALRVPSELASAEAAPKPAAPRSGPREAVLPPSSPAQAKLVLAVLALSSVLALVSLRC